MPALETVTGESLGPHWSASLIESARPEPGRDSVSENMMKSFLRCSLATTEIYIHSDPCTRTYKRTLFDSTKSTLYSHVIFTYSGTSSWVGMLPFQRLIVGRAEHGMAQTGRSIRALAQCSRGSLGRRGWPTAGHSLAGC